MLAERLAPSPRLVPADAAERFLVMGLCHEIAGENGFGWIRRITLFSARPATPLAPPPPSTRNFAVGSSVQRGYALNEQTIALAPGRLVEILTILAERLHAQRKAGSAYLVGQGLTAADIYWACFACMIDPMPHEINPMPEQVRGAYKLTFPALEAAKDKILFEHRDFIYRTHLELPLRF